MKTKKTITLLCLMLAFTFSYAQVPEIEDDEAIEYIDTEEEVEEEGEVFEIFQVQEKATFMGGEQAMHKFISEYLEFPEQAILDSVNCTVYIQFVVEKNGSISGVKPRGSRRCGSGTEEAAVKVVQKMSGKWIPARQRDKAVRMRFVLPIKFKTVG